MATNLRLVKTARELAADEAREVLVAYVDSLSLTMGQRGRMRDFITDYGLRQYEAGYDKAQTPRGDAA